MVSSNQIGLGGRNHAYCVHSSFNNKQRDQTETEIWQAISTLKSSSVQQDGFVESLQFKFAEF